MNLKRIVCEGLLGNKTSKLSKKRGEKVKKTLYDRVYVEEEVESKKNLYYSIENEEVVIYGTPIKREEMYFDERGLMLPDEIDGFPVTIIEDYAFAMLDINYVKLPRGLKEVRQGAFIGNEITEIKLPKSLEIIKEYAFGDNNFKSVHIPKNIVTLDGNSFSGNEQINEVTVEKGSLKYKDVNGLALTTLDGSTLVRGTSSGFIPSGVKKIGKGAFEGSGIKKSIIPNGVEEISGKAYVGNGISKVEFPNSLLKIGDYAFAFNEIGHLNIPKNTVSIGRSAFQNNGILNLYIPSKLEYIGESAFEPGQTKKVNVFLNSSLKGSIVNKHESYSSRVTPFGKMFEIVMSKDVCDEALIDFLRLDKEKLNVVDESELHLIYNMKKIYSA